MKSKNRKTLIRNVTCPNCWNRFSPERIKFIARHPDLIGDSIAGSNEFLRFEPMRFNVNGDAIDAKGIPTAQMACPRCHLEICSALLELSPVFISLIGAPGAGKSYFLTSLAWQMRNILPKLNLTFTDADPVANSVIHDHEHTLFMANKADVPVEIPKTQPDDPRLYRIIMEDDVAVRRPRPLQFAMQLNASHRNYDKNTEQGRVLVMYDNAGEDYLPQSSSVSSEAITHIVKSNMLFMLFDPTQDVRFKQYFKQQEIENSGLSRQETILRNIIVQLRRHLGLSEKDRIKTPLIIIIPKFDTFLGDNPFIDKDPFVSDADGNIAIDNKTVDHYSQKLRELFVEICPELVNSAEQLTESVRFIPVSSLGNAPELTQTGNRHYYGIKPGNIHPKWVTVPILYALSQWSSGIVASIKDQQVQ
ncbi:MAG: hypothetical protein JEZ07_02760 [Phycisphaerae bacterium]|nr:hypothetical protein [Phycisphaerae bacterium]